MPIANGFLYKKDFKKEYFFDLKVAFSEKLSLFQLVSNPDPKKMFNKDYPFIRLQNLWLNILGSILLIKKLSSNKWKIARTRIK